MKLLLLALGIALINAECPDVNDLPVYFNDDTFFCARFYYGHGDDLALHGCNGCDISTYIDLPDNTNQDAGDGYHYPVGSVIVRPGCTFYQFHESHYNGNWKTFEGPGVWSKVDGGYNGDHSNCAKGERSIMCRCGMRHFSCVPEDRFEVVMLCDATQAQSDVECNYIKTIGTSYTETMSSSMSLDVTVENEMKEKFFGIFESTLSVSVTTGYDWGYVSSETSSEEDSVEIRTTAPAGYVLRIEQAVGHCDGNSAKTELFRISHEDQFGNVVKQTKQKIFNNGTTILLGAENGSHFQPRTVSVVKDSIEQSVPKSIKSN